MIKTVELLYGLDLRLNKLASNEHQEIPIENKIIVLRESIIQLIVRKIDTDNDLHLGYDANKKRYHDLERLVEKPEDHELELDLLDEYSNKYGAEMLGLNPKCMFIIGGYVLADKGECKNRVIVFDIDLAKHADVSLLLKNTDYIPSFEYQETLSSISGNTFEVYTDGTFTPTKLYLSYIKYPEEIDYEGYCNFDGTPSTIVDCDLPHYLKDEILDIAVQSLAFYTENTPAAQAASAKTQTNE